MQDLKNTPKYQPRKPLGLMRGFCIAVVYAVFMGFVIGVTLTAIRTGHLLP